MFATFEPSKILAVKAINPLPGTSVATLIKPDGRVISCQPDGTIEDRNAGTDGGYERVRLSGNIATFKPVDGKYFTFGFVVVDGL